MDYTASEISEMREICRDILIPYGMSYKESELNTAAEDALRTYMQAGISVMDLRDEQRRMDEARWKKRIAEEKFMETLRSRMPPEPPSPTTEQEVMEQWFSDCVAKYSGACATTDELFDGFMGHTLKRFANHHAPDGVRVSKRRMEKFLESQGVKFRRVGFMGGRTWDGIRHIIGGNVRHGNYMT